MMAHYALEAGAGTGAVCCSKANRFACWLHFAILGLAHVVSVGLQRGATPKFTSSDLMTFATPCSSTRLRSPVSVVRAAVQKITCEGARED